METDADRLDSIRALGGIFISMDGRDVLALFENDSIDAQPGTLVVQSSGPRLTCRTVDVKDIPTGTTVQVGTDEYVVATNDPDGTGMSLLLLERP